MDKIILTRMAFYGYHGVFAEENKLGQQFYIDAELSLPLDEAGRSDELEHTVNYAEVYHTIQGIVEGKTFRLLEALAENIASTLLQTYTSINEIKVRVIKPHPPFKIFFEGVTVEITRKREAGWIQHKS
ncbi:dihydroneopterin aldolase [Paenibacillus psychroresistens]|uniref:7,8-dihydroneopterin aldolase n=1 Tax=Paenibacillus psychroresistens TaxID=1778678 RepID=A0A6B8RD93_9BACL|nr:dihydroneopterin aldolase [Paenibacillus psychroresistens]QGQ93714.1 dihydroneopterin aldolase [Paenibacillus psychroresistens]